MPRLLPTGDAQKSLFPAFPVPIYIQTVVDDEKFNPDLEKKIGVLKENDPARVMTPTAGSQLMYLQ